MNTKKGFMEVSKIEDKIECKKEKMNEMREIKKEFTTLWDDVFALESVDDDIQVEVLQCINKAYGEIREQTTKNILDLKNDEQILTEEKERVDNSKAEIEKVTEKVRKVIKDRQVSNDFVSEEKNIIEKLESKCERIEKNLNAINKMYEELSDI